METDMRERRKVRRKNGQEDAREAALRLLDYRDRSVSEMRSRLAGKSYSAEEIEKVISDLMECGLLDDRRFAELLVRSGISAGKGRFVLARRLKEKGIDPLTAEQVLDKMMEEEDEGMLCLRRALSICGLSGCCEIGEDGEICLLQEEASTLPPGKDALDYFEPQDESIRSDRNARYRYREKEKARLIRRLLSAGFSPGIVYDVVRRIEQL